MDKINNSFEKIPEISFAKPNDISGILEIQKTKLLKERGSEKKSDLQNTGFLVNELSEKDLSSALENNQEILIVAKGNQEITGYMFGYDFDKLLSDNPSWLRQTDLDQKIFDNEKVIYGKHVASKGNFSRIGERLNQKFFEIAKSRGYTFYIGEILESPIRNERSIAKHSQLFNFQRIGKYTDNDNFVWGIYSKKI